MLRQPLRVALTAALIAFISPVMLASSAAATPVGAQLVPVIEPGPLPAAGPIRPSSPTRRHARCARTLPAAGDSTAPPPGHALLDVATAHRFSRGAGVKVAVIDTGVAPHRRLPDLIPGGDYVSNGDGLSDCDAHGTLVAGIIAARPSAGDAFVGVAPEATIISIRQSSGAYRATSARGSAATVGVGYGPLTTLAKAIVRAVDLGAGVINISETACLPRGENPGDSEVGRALRHARDQDVVTVVAAGNLADATSCRTQNPVAAASPATGWSKVATIATPARFAPLVLSVGATTAIDGSPAEFTLRGPWVSVAAPGTGTVSIAPGPHGPRLVNALSGADGAVPLAGTSYAAAYVAGTAALVRSRFPEASADDVLERILRTAHSGGNDTAVGHGIIDPVAALTAELPGAATMPDPAAGHAIAAPSPDTVADSGLSRILLGAVLACGVVLAGRRARTAQL